MGALYPECRTTLALHDERRIQADLGAQHSRGRAAPILDHLPDHDSRKRETPSGHPEVTMPDTEMLIRLIAAAALGSLIGFERERLLWAAGIRTHMLVCVGSCLIMIVSQYGFSNILTHQNVVLDPSRIAAQVVSGIGFLGAGA